MRGTGSLIIVGCGALTRGTLTGDAAAALERADVIVGYTGYTRPLAALFPDKKFLSTAMKKETDRVREAIGLAAGGATVCLVCSGDAGIYGMAGLAYELLEREPAAIDVTVLPGVPALALCAASLGAPLMNDFAVISFSDLLTPQDTIIRRLDAFLASGAVVVIYNPVSVQRRPLFERLWARIAAARGDCWGGFVKSGAKTGEERGIHRIGTMPLDRIDMHTLLVVGNEHTAVIGDRLVTRRGYKIGG